MVEPRQHVAFIFQYPQRIMLFADRPVALVSGVQIFARCASFAFLIVAAQADLVRPGGAGAFDDGANGDAETIGISACVKSTQIATTGPFDRRRGRCWRGRSGRSGRSDCGNGGWRCGRYRGCRRDLLRTVAFQRQQQIVDFDAFGRIGEAGKFDDGGKFSGITLPRRSLHHLPHGLGQFGKSGCGARQTRQQY